MSNMFIDLFDLRTDQADAAIIDVSIRDNVKVAGTNLWVLIFAILIASVGLNVNSAAVIIGAMLISPLMGPIVGIGYGVGINDIDLIKLALRNLGVFTVISIIASALYFTISPLNFAQSELLARTSPTIWDVLIAFFGGSAGIIATTRKSVSNVVPGVAIATALMPPLCTAGFGIAQGNFAYFGGAFFLYIINSLFIALSTFMFVKIFHLPKHKYVDKKTEKRTHLFIMVMVLMVSAPSGLFGYNLVQNSRFSQIANEFVNESYRDNTFILFGHEVHPQIEEVILTIGGTDNPDALKTELEKVLKSEGFSNAHVIMRYSGTGEIDLGSLKTQLTQDLYNNMVQQVDELSKKNKSLEAEVLQTTNQSLSDKDLFNEMRAQYPAIQKVSVSRGRKFIIMSSPVISPPPDSTDNDNTNSQTVDNTSIQPTTQETETKTSDIIKKELLLLMVESSEPLSDDDKTRVKSWLDIKYAEEHVEVRFDVVDNDIINDVVNNDVETTE